VGMAVALDLRDAGVLSYERRRTMLYVHGRFAEWMTSKQYRGCDCATWHTRETTMALAPWVWAMDNITSYVYPVGVFRGISRYFVLPFSDTSSPTSLRL
jgi:hypothetical protein